MVRITVRLDSANFSKCLSSTRDDVASRPVMVQGVKQNLLQQMMTHTIIHITVSEHYMHPLKFIQEDIKVMFMQAHNSVQMHNLRYGSLPEVGSSRKMTLGRLSNCRAIASRFF